MAQKPLSYCGQSVKDNDPDRFLLSLFAPAQSREGLWALFAFNHEIAKTREVVSDSTLGRIRLQWWRDAIAGIYEGKKPLDHAVVAALADTIRAHDLPQENFETLLEARAFDLENTQPENIEGLLHYADFTSSPLLAMAVQVSGGNAAYEPVQAAALNYALAGLLRAVPYHTRQGRCYLPVDILRRHGITREFLSKHEKRGAVVEAVADHAVQGVKTQHRFLKAANLLSFIYLKKIRRLGYDVFDPKMAIPPAFKEIRLLRALF